MCAMPCVTGRAKIAFDTPSQLGDSLAEFLVDATPDPKLRQLMSSMAEALRTIAFKVRMIQGKKIKQCGNVLL